MGISVLAVFLAVLMVPWVPRIAGRWTGWILAPVPLAVAVFYGSQIPSIAAGDTLSAAWDWAPGLGVALSFRLDGWSLLFALLISGIGGLVVVYAGGYLAGDPRLGSFCAYLFAFMGSMLGLVLADNLLTLFTFWELTSVTSYLLIGFDRHPQARAAALQALLVTAGGGLALLAGLVLLGLAGGTFELSGLLADNRDLRQHAWYVPMLLLILLGAFTKSAQFPFHFWLPNAMAAPTPVSAYLHSATMVKAGIYLIGRLHPVLGGTPWWFWLISIVGGLTTLMGAVMAFRSTDLKQILAHSTISMLGAMMMLLGLGNAAAMVAVVAVLLAHAMYKAGLFLVAGIVDHAAHQRDIRGLAGLAAALPISASAAVLLGLAMAGVWPALAFIGKELYYAALLGQLAPAAELAGASIRGAPQIGGLPAVTFVAVALIANMLLAAVAGLVCVKPFFGRRSEAGAGAHEGPPSLWLGPLLLGVLGFVLVLVPQATQPLVAAAAAAVFGGPAPIKLVLWHGVNTELVLSGVTLAGGLLLYAQRSRLGGLDRGLASLTRVGPTRWYAGALTGLDWVARGQTRVLQNGYLRVYLMSIIGTLLLLGWLALQHEGFRPLPQQVWDARLAELAVAGLILLGAAVAVTARSRLTAILALGLVGYGAAGVYVLFGAPDLAMTQFVIETLTVILLVLVFYHLPDFKQLSRRRAQLRDALIAAAAGGTVTLLLLSASAARKGPPVSDFYARHSLPDAHGRNVVNVILVDFRALDTFGEITVLAIAGMGVYSLLKLRLQEQPEVSGRAAAELPGGGDGPPAASAEARET